MRQRNHRTLEGKFLISPRQINIEHRQVFRFHLIPSFYNQHSLLSLCRLCIFTLTSGPTIICKASRNSYLVAIATATFPSWPRMVELQTATTPTQAHNHQCHTHRKPMATVPDTKANLNTRRLLKPSTNNSHRITVRTTKTVEDR